MEKSILLINPLIWFVLFSIADFFSAIFIYATMNKKVNIVRCAIFGILCTIINISTRIYCSMEVIFILGLSSYILLAILLLRLNILQSLLVIFLLIIAQCPGEIFAAFITNLMGLSNEMIKLSFQYNLLRFIISFSVFLLITLIIYYYRININLIEDISRKRNFSLVVNGLLTLILIVPNILFFTISTTKIPIYLILFNVVAIFVFFGLSLYNTLQGAKLNSKSQQLEIQMLYNKTMNDLVNSLKGFRHDFSNTLNAINGYIILNDIDGLKTYFNQLNSDYSSINSLSFANSTIINNPPVYGLIVSKFYSALSKGITINLDITTDILNPKIKIYQLCKFLGIFWDNAIEAAEECENKIINFILKEDEKFYLLKIENSFSGNVNMQEIFKKGISSKGIDRGIGLWEVKSITDKSKFVTLKTSIKNNIFSHEMIFVK